MMAKGSDQIIRFFIRYCLFVVWEVHHNVRWEASADLSIFLAFLPVSPGLHQETSILVTILKLGWPGAFFPIRFFVNAPLSSISIMECDHYITIAISGE